MACSVLLFRSGMRLAHRCIAAAQNANVVADMPDVEQPRLDTVVEVSRKVCNLVGQIDDLRFQRRPFAEEVLS